METITIKPHHFLDVIKLYGSGIEVFVPDEKMGHDFYQIANKIIQNPYLQCQLTITGDDICLPCSYYQHHQCQDIMTHISNLSSKNQYNQLLDQRIMKLYQLTHQSYQALELCEIFYLHHEWIERIWLEEDEQTVQRRHDFFVKGACLYIKKYKT